ncbi:MAG: LytR C-terminal domain-containing protein [Gaiellaceae bacterium]
MHALRILDVTADDSPLEAARSKRTLSREEAAQRAALSPDEVAWLEEGRLYRFATPQRAVGAIVAYAAGLGVEHREALELAGRPVPPLPPDTMRARLFAGAAVLTVIALLAATFALVRLGGSDGDSRASATLPPTWRVEVDVLNGSGDRNYTQKVADRIGGLAYNLGHVRKAGRFDYPETAVYYPPGAQALAKRLAAKLCVPTKPLPGGKRKNRLVVIVGPPTVDAAADC